MASSDYSMEAEKHLEHTEIHEMGNEHGKLTKSAEGDSITATVETAEERLNVKSGETSQPERVAAEIVRESEDAKNQVPDTHVVSDMEMNGANTSSTQTTRECEGNVSEARERTIDREIVDEKAGADETVEKKNDSEQEGTVGTKRDMSGGGDPEVLSSDGAKESAEGGEVAQTIESIEEGIRQIQLESTEVADDLETMGRVVENDVERDEAQVRKEKEVQAHAEAEAQTKAHVQAEREKAKRGKGAKNSKQPKAGKEKDRKNGRERENNRDGGDREPNRDTYRDDRDGYSRRSDSGRDTHREGDRDRDRMMDERDTYSRRSGGAANFHGRGPQGVSRGYGNNSNARDAPHSGGHASGSDRDRYTQASRRGENKRRHDPPIEVHGPRVESSAEKARLDAKIEEIRLRNKQEKLRLAEIAQDKERALEREKAASERLAQEQRRLDKERAHTKGNDFGWGEDSSRGWGESRRGSHGNQNNRHYNDDRDSYHRDNRDGDRGMDDRYRGRRRRGEDDRGGRGGRESQLSAKSRREEAGKRAAEENRWREERRLVDESRVQRAMTLTDNGETVWRRAWDKEKTSDNREGVRAGGVRLPPRESRQRPLHIEEMQSFREKDTRTPSPDHTRNEYSGDDVEYREGEGDGRHTDSSSKRSSAHETREDEDGRDRHEKTFDDSTRDRSEGLYEDRRDANDREVNTRREAAYRDARESDKSDEDGEDDWGRKVYRENSRDWSIDENRDEIGQRRQDKDTGDGDWGGSVYQERVVGMNKGRGSAAAKEPRYQRNYETKRDNRDYEAKHEYRGREDQSRYAKGGNQSTRDGQSDGDRQDRRDSPPHEKYANWGDVTD
ncbi:hypothetical protein SARC_10809, partial [Sphaeroforma arctica JP610]